MYDRMPAVEVQAFVLRARDGVEYAVVRDGEVLGRESLALIPLLAAENNDIVFSTLGKPDPRSDTELALNLRQALNTDDEQAMIEAEGAIIERLGIDPDETEQGLTRDAVRRIESFVADYTSAGWSYESEGCLGVNGVD